MPLPARLARIVDTLAAAPRDFRIEALLDFSNRVPPLPDGMSLGDLETVPECQTSFLLATTVDPEGKVHMFFDAPAESPTVRGFAGILHAGLEGEDAEAILAVPGDLFHSMGLEDIVTPLRLQGMGAILARLKRQVRDHLASR